jgi:hypothetical protein
MKKQILGIIIILSFSSCVTYGDKYYTYELEGSESRYTVLPNKAWAFFNIHGRYEIKFEDYVYFSFSLRERGEIWLPNRVIKTEPYDLEMAFPSKNTDRIIFNEMIFQSNNKNIDLRKKVTIEFRGKRHRERLENESSRDYEYHKFEEELIDFRDSGIIDLNKFNDEWRAIDVIYISYNDVDVVFEKDHYFDIKYDINFEGDYEPLHLDFTAKFKRGEFTERKPWGWWLTA